MEHILDLNKVTKRYSSKTAVQEVSLSIPRGCIFGLLGPNGAGKTSILRMITGITGCDEGSISFLGKPLDSIHRHEIGYMPEERGLYKKMKVGEQLEYLIQLKGLSAELARKSVYEWMKRLEIYEWKNRQVTELSKGMQQKIQFIATIAHNPTLLILDEPFSGLDPINARMIEDIILELKSKGTTILFSTHRMEQVELFCDRIALINQARIILEGETSAIRMKFRKNIFVLASDASLDFVADLPQVVLFEKTLEGCRIELNPDCDIQAFAIDLFGKVLLTKFEHHLPGLNEIFIESVKNDPRHE